MPQVQVLAPHLADLIAAGEVVERPASAVKELLENAIDAGASKISVSIVAGGMESITITDNGCGMSPDDAVTAFLRHATSKIRTEEDLEAIDTLGFRGEALAAISAVSRVECHTRQAEHAMGWAVFLEGGEVLDSRETGAPLGTTIVVRNLFYNTPARRKFLKKDTYEAAACLQAVQRAALSHPEISFKYTRDGKSELLTPGDQSAMHAIEAVFGREISLGLLPIASSDEDKLSVSGFVSKPVCCRGSRSHQLFFLNGRFIKSRSLTAAVEQAFANQKMVGKFPAFVVYLQTKANFVDCNVHPTKVEVKFADERRVFSLIYHAVESALNAITAAPSPIMRTPVRDTVSPNQMAFRSMSAAEYQTLPREFQSKAAVADHASYRSAAPARTTAPQRNFAPSTIIPQKPDAVGATPTIAPEAPPQTPREPEPMILAPEQMQPDYVLRGEAFSTYIMLERGEELIFIDKHAAHERMNFDRMKAQSYTPMVQQLLAPLTLQFSPEQAAALLEQQALVAQFGFQIEDFGAGMLRLSAAPHDIAEGDLSDTLSELAEGLLRNGTADPAAARDEMLHTMSCKAAIKGGWTSSEEELLAIARPVMAGEVRYCPHGRPVSFSMTRAEFERRFKR